MRQKPVLNFENYTISEFGVITNTNTNKIKRCWLGKVGYYYVDLYKEGKSKKVALHRLLAIAFLPNQENKRTVNHIDGDKTNNSLYNLEWSTDSENMQHAYDKGLNNGSNLFTETEYVTFLSDFIGGMSMTDIAIRENVSVATITTNLKRVVIGTVYEEAYNSRLLEQRIALNKNIGKKQRKTITLHMICKDTGDTLKIFSSLTEAGEYLDKKSCGPIANVLSGRAKTAYGYFWYKH